MGSYDYLAASRVNHTLILQDWAVLLPDDEVARFLSDNRLVVSEQLFDAANGAKMRINNTEDNWRPPLPVEDVLKRARSLLQMHSDRFRYSSCRAASPWPRARAAAASCSRSGAAMTRHRRYMRGAGAVTAS